MRHHMFCAQLRWHCRSQRPSMLTMSGSIQPEQITWIHYWMKAAAWLLAASNQPTLAISICLPVLPPSPKRYVEKLLASKNAQDKGVIPPHVVQFKHALPRLKPRKSFLRCVDPLERKITTWKEEVWERKLEELPSSSHLNIKPNESLPPGS